MGPKLKKQKSILDFSFQLPAPPEPVLVDLTSDQHPAIACPVCSISMEKWEIDVRIRHVEDCLSVMAIREERFEFLSGNSGSGEPSKASERRTSEVRSLQVKAEIRETPAKQTETQQVQPSLEAKEETKKRRRKPDQFGAQKEMVKYINTKCTVKRAKKPAPETTTQEEEPKELLPSSRKHPIPELKTLRFPILGDVHYEVSVDAFRYKPHETISQYFLSHFHSDHYGGITKRWCSERTLASKIIYCSPITSKLLTLRFGVSPEFIYEMAINSRHKVYSYCGEMANGGEVSEAKDPGLYVTSIDANHCPGAAIFLFESVSLDGESSFTLHCGDFRINKAMVDHPALRPFHLGQKKTLDKVYLDTTYMSPKYNFPKQEYVCDAVADMFEKVVGQSDLFNEWFGTALQSRITDFLSLSARSKKKKFLVLVGTYLIGKERLAMAILKRMGECPIFVSNINSRGDKDEIIRAFDDPYLKKVVTTDDIGDDSSEIMVHLVPMKIVGSAPELSNYFNHNQYFKHFERCVGLRPTGWSFEDSGNDEFVSAEDEVPVVDDVSLLSTLSVLRSHPEYSYMDILRQNRPKADRKMDKSTFKIYLLPYSEHLSYRELSFFVVFLNIAKVIPTVNTENAWSASRMEEIIQKWELVRHIKTTRKSTLPDGLVNMIYDLSLADL